MPKVDFAKVADNDNFEPLPTCPKNGPFYPCVLEVSNVLKDTSGGIMKDADGNPAIQKTNAGDEQWSIKATILDGKYIGKWVSDRISFGTITKKCRELGCQKLDRCKVKEGKFCSNAPINRVRTIFVRAGIAEENKSHDCEPEEIDGTYWWVNVDRHEARMKDGVPKLRKDGQPILDPRVAFAGYEPMTPLEAKRYRESYATWLAKKNGQAADNGASEGEAGDSDVPF